MKDFQQNKEEKRIEIMNEINEEEIEDDFRINNQEKTNFQKIRNIFQPSSLITDFVGEKITKKLGSRPKIINDFMKSRGNQRIIEIQVCRTPVEKYLKKIINFLTFGKLEKTEKKLNYDDIFHLFLKFRLENGESYSIEKNQTVIIRKNPESRYGECKYMNVREYNKTFNEVIIMSEKKHGPNFYRYDFVKYNCQRFLLNITQELTGKNEFMNFIYQDFRQTISKPIRNAGGLLTDFAGLYDHLFGKSITFRD